MARRVGANRKRSTIERKKTIGKNVKHGVRGLFVTTGIVLGVCVAGYAGSKGFGAIKKYIEKSDYFSVKNVIIEGAVQSLPDSIRIKSAITPGMKLYSVVDKKVSDAISKELWVDKVELEKRFNGLVYIRIRERKPIAVVNVGEIHCVDKQGVLLPFASGVLFDMPLFTGLKDSTDAAGKHIIVEKDMVRLLTFLNETKKIDAINAFVSQVDFSKSDRIRISCKASRVLLDIGSQGIAESMMRLTYIEPILKEQNGKPALINMMYEDLAFVIQEETVKEEILKAVND